MKGLTYQEKHETVTESKQRYAPRIWQITVFALGLLWCGVTIVYPTKDNHLQLFRQASCPVQPVSIPVSHTWNSSQAYRSALAEKLSRAVQIPAISYDDMGPVNGSDADRRWKTHGTFNAFLQDEFPELYSQLSHDLVNTYGHLYTWQGSDPSLQPIILMAHQDVVPVNPATLDQWTWPPFEGKIEDGWVWGRGSADCKNQLMGILNAVQKLLGEGHEPKRTILISFGFDEEIGGSRGAQHLAAEIERRYGIDSIAFLIDEGFGGVDEAYGATFASLGMAEKGSLNLDLKIETLGGHSSVPPEHTGIGLMAQVINHLEASPFEPHLSGTSPYLKYLTCLAEHAPDLPTKLRTLIRSPRKWNTLVKVLARDVKSRAFLSTTQAVDLIRGGVKVNALPEEVTATVNYRIDFTSSVGETKEAVASSLLPLARRMGLDYIAFNKSMIASDLESLRSTGRLVLQAGSEDSNGLEPAPITSSKGRVFDLIGGTIKGVFGNDSIGNNVIIAPSAMIANTDTRAYWQLTRHLYRFLPASIAEFQNPHTVNERLSINAHLTTVQFFYQLILNLEDLKEE